MAAEKPLPPAGAEHFHVRADRHLGGFRPLHRLPAAVLQAATATASTTCEAAVEIRGISSMRDHRRHPNVLRKERSIIITHRHPHR